MSSNIILAPYNTPYGAYPFDRIKTEDFRPAFAEALKLKRAEIDEIINNPEPPTFANTILALEHAGKAMEQVSGVFYNLLYTDRDDELSAISEELVPELTELSSYIMFSEPLFERIRSVYETREELNLTEEELRLLTTCYEGFAENGALLPAEDKARLKELSQELSQAGLNFSLNALKEDKAFRLHISNSQEVEGMPETILTMAHEKAVKEGYAQGWLFDLSAPSYLAFMKYCPSSERRKEMYIAKSSVACAGGEHDNKANIRTLINGRIEEAKLLGYPTFAHYALHKRMAKTPETVYKLLDDLLTLYKPVAEREVEELRTFAKQESPDEKIHAWDWSYWAEKYKQRYYQLEDELLRPYFELDNVVNAVFGLATKLYGISFRERTDLPRYHEDVRVYEVLNEDESYLGLLYTDFFPRDSKQSGAWMNNLQEQYISSEGEDHRPHIVVVMNFTPPSAEAPSLLTIGEVETLLHEFGHALHGLFSECRFSSLSGTNVARDFVELPSQLMENWLTEPEWLAGFARHYQTREALPDEYLERLLKAKHFMVGTAACRQLSFGYLDMAWHTRTDFVTENEDLPAFERKAWEKALILPPSQLSIERGFLMSASFGHIFSGGYSAGYYSYKWAEVLDADAFAAFKEAGIFDRATANRFRKEVLSQGDKREAMDLYRAFRGQEPNPYALVERDGIPVAKD